AKTQDHENARPDRHDRGHADHAVGSDPFGQTGDAWHVSVPGRGQEAEQPGDRPHRGQQTRRSPSLTNTDAARRRSVACRRARGARSVPFGGTLTMAVIDESRGVLVVRIVYDGPAMSGKTTSLRTLARGVSSRVECPDELGGRTLYFDWVDYVGGLFEGRQIRCQIVSVPGQRALAHRRKLLLESADAVVLVLDTRREEWDFALRWVEDTAPYCRARQPPVGLVLQANKRDAPEAVGRDEMRESLNRIAPLAVVPSSATTGEGIREAFVLAVRLALDRVRALSATGQLAVGRALDDQPRELLDRMRAAEGEGERVHRGLAEAVAHSLAAEQSADCEPPA